MESDRVRRVLEPYLADLAIAHDDHYRMVFRDDKWYEVNDAIKLDGSWVKSTMFTKAHWQIPK